MEIEKVDQVVCSQKAIWLFVITLLCLGVSAKVSGGESPDLPTFNPQAKYCLLFTVDGLDRDYITSDTTPNLYRWKNAGVELPGALNVYPTATTANMSSLYTGAFPIHTGVGGNLVFVKNEKKLVVGPRPRNVVTINDAFQSAGHRTAGVQMYMMDKADRYLHVKNLDAHDVTSMTLSLLADKQSVPTLMAVLFQSVDHIGHKYGPDTVQAKTEAAKVDAEIAAIVKHYSDLAILQDTMVVITADHGMSATDKVIDQAQVNKAIAGMGLKCEWLSRAGQKISDDADLYLLLAGNLQGYFNRDFSSDEQQRLFAELGKVQGLGTVHDAMTLRRMNCDPSGGDFVMEPADGWRFRGNRGTHGTNRESDGYESFFGAGVKAGVVIKNARTVDIMPTILQALHVPIPATVDGRPLADGLR